jgi:DNA-binding response OmpR family regulator
MARILIVDDDALMVEVLGVVLETAGHSVAASSDGKYAFDLANREAFDLVVMDWTLDLLRRNVEIGSPTAHEVHREEGCS